MLSGYKTYIIGGVTIIGALANYIVGDASLADTLHFVVDAALAMAVRSGVNSVKVK